MALAPQPGNILSASEVNAGVLGDGAGYVSENLATTMGSAQPTDSFALVQDLGIGTFGAAVDNSIA